LSRFRGLDGIRDKELLESALNRPRQHFHYERPSIFELAATYAHGIVKNHPFLDGNKRSGFMAAGLFLEFNGQRLQAPETEAVLQTVALAAGELSQENFSLWLERHSQPFSLK
ncbi:MAG: type II toxin-antitoxin system death-on-curing family toxin, partial [Kiritimatiellia bacterium]